MTRIRAGLTLATVAASAAVLIPASPSVAAPAKGLQDQEMTVNHPRLRTSFLADAKAAKVKLLRFNTRWNGKSSVPDIGQLAEIRVTATAAADYGVKQILVVPALSGGDSFNPKGKRRGPTASSKVSATAYRKYIRGVAESLQDIPGIEVLYAPVNEPNWFRHLPKRGGAAMYRKLHNTAYDEIKKVDPDAKVLFGELLPYARKLSKNYPHGQSTNAGSFVREVLGLDKKWKARGSSKTYTIKADGVSLHTYDFKADPRKKRSNRDDWTQANLGYSKSDLRKAAKTKRLPAKAVSNLYLTEFAYKTKGSDKISTSKARTYLKRAWDIAKKQKAKSFVWYQLRDPQTSAELWQSGLQTRSGGSRATWSVFRTLR